MAKRKKLAPTPIIRTKTITAAGLLRKIRALVLEEPKRLNMNAWVQSFRGRDPDRNEKLVLGREDPACGTVGCIAGWGSILLRKRSDSPQDLMNEASQRMRAALGFVDYQTTWSLFDYQPQACFGEDIHDYVIGGEPGTKAHAKAVANRIDVFLQQHPELESRVIQVR